MDLLAKLRLVRQKEDIQLPETPYFRKTYTHRSGEERPLKLRGYQAQMVINLLAMKRFVVGDDTGLGKTIETVASLCQVWAKQPKKKAIVVTKKSSMTPGWEIEGFGAFTQGVKVIMALGGPKKRAKARQEWLDHDGPVVIIYSYGSWANDFSETMGWEDYIIVFDEATVFKNPKTRIHKVCKHSSAQADRCWSLTATLIKNDLMEGYGIYRVTVPGLFNMNEQTFMQSYALVEMKRVGRNRRVPVIVGYHKRHIELFRQQIELYYLGRPKHAVAKDLPMLTSRDVKIGLTSWQKEKYKEALSGLMEHGDGEIRDFTETTQLTSLIYCQEIVNHPGLIEYPDYRSTKLEALTEMLTEGEFEGEKVIIFTRFSKMVGIARAHLESKGLKCVTVTGGESSKQRKEAMLSFQNPKDPTNVIFITMAGGDAINLQAAKALIFYDTPWSAGDYIQILGRMIRIGSEHDRVYAIHLVCQDTIDEHVQAVVKKKMALIQAVLGERVKGEKGETRVFQNSSDTQDLFDALQADARRQKGGTPQPA
jgi:SNF2 family DNA or RNA helicase